MTAYDCFFLEKFAGNGLLIVESPSVDYNDCEVGNSVQALQA